MTPVFEAIAQSVFKLIACDYAAVITTDGKTFRTCASMMEVGPTERIHTEDQIVDPAINLPSRVIVTKEIQHLPDWTLLDLPDFDRDTHDSFGVNASLTLPLLRGDDCVGALGLLRTEKMAFTQDEIIYYSLMFEAVSSNNGMVSLMLGDTNG